MSNFTKEIPSVLDIDSSFELSVIIVNYNTGNLLVRCLTSISFQTSVNFEVIVVDNASHDGSSDLVINNFPDVKLLKNERNLGFARANNQALKECKGKYIYFLNPDTEVRPGAFRTIIDFMESHSNVGLAGTRLVNPDGSLQSSVENRYPGQRYAKKELNGLKGDIAWVLGASMIARQDLINILEGFDEHFFLYGEDLDLCMRIRKSGWIIDYIPDAEVLHWGGQSERESLPIEVWKKKFRAESLFYRKHYSIKTIKAIERGNLVQAYWRVLTLRLTLPFSRNKREKLAKLEKYKLVTNMSKKPDPNIT